MILTAREGGRGRGREGGREGERKGGREGGRKGNQWLYMYMYHCEIPTKMKKRRDFIYFEGLEQYHCFLRE